MVYNNRFYLAHSKHSDCYIRINSYFVHKILNFARYSNHPTHEIHCFLYSAASSLHRY